MHLTVKAIVDEIYQMLWAGVPATQQAGKPAGRHTRAGAEQLSSGKTLRVFHRHTGGGTSPVIKKKNKGEEKYFGHKKRTHEFIMSP